MMKMGEEDGGAQGCRGSDEGDSAAGLSETGGRRRGVLEGDGSPISHGVVLEAV